MNMPNLPPSSDLLLLEAQESIVDTSDINPDDIFNQPPPRPLARNQAEHLHTRLGLWGQGMISDEDAYATFRHLRLPLMKTLTNLLSDEPLLYEEEGDTHA